MIGDHPAELRVYKIWRKEKFKGRVFLFRFFGGQKNEKSKSKK